MRRSDRSRAAVPATSVTTRRAVAGVLARSASGQVLGTAVLAAIGWRSRSGRVRPSDAVAFAVAVLVHPFVEYGVHRYALHAPVRSVAGRPVDLAPGHRRHHADPSDLALATLPGPAAAIDAALLGSLAAACAGMLGGRQAAATAAATSIGALLRYEWVHLGLHAAITPLTAHGRRLRTHHRLHHRRDERAWFAVTVVVTDRWFRTAPDPRTHRPAAPAAPAAASAGR